jgi:hypothetical protein
LIKVGTLPPDDWEQVRGRWLIAHFVRSVLALAAFVLLVTAATGRETRKDWSAADARAQQMPHTLP